MVRMHIKGLIAGVVLVVLVGIAGFFYRSVKERPVGPIACQQDAKVCPDGTGLGRMAPLCTFPTCPPPNVELADAQIAFALPLGYTPTALPDEDALAAFTKTDDLGVESFLYIRTYTLAPDVTAASFIRENAIMDGSGLPASPTAFSSITLGSAENGRRQFSMVQLGRFEGVILTVYYLSYEGKVFRFDAQSRNVTNWTDPALDSTKLPANQDLQKLLGTLQGG